MSAKSIAASVVVGIVAGGAIAVAMFGPQKLGCLYSTLTTGEESLACQGYTPAQIQATAIQHDGDTFVAQGRIADAITAYKKAQAVDPTAANPLARIGIRALRAKNFEAAIAYLTAYIDGADQTLPAGALVGAYMGRARALIELGKSDEALNDYGDAIKRVPTDQRPLLVRAELYTKLQRPTDAIADLTAAISLPPTSAVAFQRRSALRAGLKDFNGAIQDADAAVRMDPNEPAYHYNRVSVLIKSRKFDDADKAIADMEKAGGVSADSELLRAWNLEQHGNTKLAMEALERCQALREPAVYQDIAKRRPARSNNAPG